MQRFFVVLLTLLCHSLALATDENQLTQEPRLATSESVVYPSIEQLPSHDNSSEYRLQSGDKIRIYLPGENAFDNEFEVDAKGSIMVPEIGRVQLVGLRQSELSDYLRARLSEVFVDLSNLQVSIAEKRLLITVSGYVQSPGEYNLPANANVQTVLHAAGGLRPGAQLDKLRVKRYGQDYLFNYKAYLDSGDTTSLPNLQSLDEIFVPASQKIGNVEMNFDPSLMADAGDAADDRKAVKVFGEVRSPGSFSYRDGDNVIDMLMRAGGVTEFAGVKQIRLLSEKEPILFDLNEYLDTGNKAFLPQLTEGTTIFVPVKEEEVKISSRMLYIMGEVRAPGAYEGRDGITFMDILANAGGPTKYADTRKIRIIGNDGSIRAFDLTDFTEGDNPVQPEVFAGDAIFVPEKLSFNQDSWLKVPPSQAVRVIGEVVKPGRYEWSDEMDFIDLLAHAGGPTKTANTNNIEIITYGDDGKAQIVEFNLDTYLQTGDRQKLPLIRAGSLIRFHELPYDPQDNKSQWLRQSSDQSIYIFGEVISPGRFKFSNEMHFLDIISAADGPSNNADLRNIVVTHRNQKYAKTTKVDLYTYFQTGDESILPVVRTNDSIYVPSKERMWVHQPVDETVRVLGAVSRPGRYEFADDMSILDLIAEAGGTQADAYLEKITVVNLSCCKDQAKTFDMIEFSKTANYGDLPVLRAGDTVYVPYRSHSPAAEFRTTLSDIFQMVSLASLLGLM